jgi:hypothetical protein
MIILPTLLEKELFGILLLNPNPWIVGISIMRKYDWKARGWMWGGLAFLIVLVISTLILYWLAMVLYGIVHGFQLGGLYG